MKKYFFVMFAIGLFTSCEIANIDESPTTETDTYLGGKDEYEDVDRDAYAYDGGKDEYEDVDRD